MPPNSLNNSYLCLIYARDVSQVNDPVQCLLVRLDAEPGQHRFPTQGGSVIYYVTEIGKKSFFTKRTYLWDKSSKTIYNTK